MNKRPIDFSMSDFSFDSFEFEDNTEESLQRTKEWLLKRNGCFTGSQNKLLMGCGRSTSKQAWGSVEKLVDFGETAQKFIYKVGKQRTTDVLEMEINSKPTNYGTEQEPFLLANLEKDGIVKDFEELNFEYFGEYENGGASADGRIVYTGTKYPRYTGMKIGLELKCCVSWDGHYKRMYEPVHEKHEDFWQHQSEMLAMGVDALLYVVAEPMTVEKYSIQIVQASELHQKMLLARCKIADEAIKLWDRYTYKDALQVACANYAEENEIVN